MTEAEAAARLEELARDIAYHNKRYHDEDTPEITDQEYDALVRENNAALEAQFPHLVREDSPSKQVGAGLRFQRLSKVPHEVPMFSLDNAFSDEEMADFVGRVRRFLNLPEDEAVALYGRGQDRRPVLLAALRGAAGWCARHAAATGRSARTSPPMSATSPTSPKCCADKAPAVFEVRGEVYMEKQAFTALNAAQGGGAAASRCVQFAHPRNSAAGSLRQKDANVTATAAAAPSSPGAGARRASCRTTPSTTMMAADRGSGACRFRRCSERCETARGIAAALCG